MLQQISATTPQLTWEFIDSKELARRCSPPESWVRDQVRRRTADPLPHIRFGKYVRYRWGSPELENWAERRVVGLNIGTARKPPKRESIQ